MKLTPLGVALTVLAVGLAAFGWNVTRREPAPAAAGVSEPELRWLQSEYRLDDAAMRRIAPLHRAHVVECERHCKALAGNEGQMQGSDGPLPGGDAGARRSRATHQRTR